jgi:hypothetical protein
MRLHIPFAIAVAILVLPFIPKHEMRTGSATIDPAKLDAAELLVQPGIAALRGMEIKALKECFLGPESRLRLVGSEQGDDGAVLHIQVASGRIMLIHFRFFDNHRYALLDTIVTPEGLHIIDPQQLWGMAHATILGNCGSRDPVRTPMARNMR